MKLCCQYATTIHLLSWPSGILSLIFVIILTFQVQFSLLSMGEDQLEIKSICDSLGIRVIAYSPLGLGMLTGKYSASKLPTGPRCVDIYANILERY